MTEEQIDGDKRVFEMLTRQHCCPTSDGAGAAIIASEEFVKKHGLEYKAVEVAAQCMVTDLPGTFDEDKLSLMTIAGYDCSKTAAAKIYDQAGITADQVNVVELHDCFSANELITYEAIGLCPEGGAGEFIDSGNNTYGGRVVVNPSGWGVHELKYDFLNKCSRTFKLKLFLISFFRSQNLLSKRDSDF